MILVKNAPTRSIVSITHIRFEDSDCHRNLVSFRLYTNYLAIDKSHLIKDLGKVLSLENLNKNSQPQITAPQTGKGR